MMKKLFLILFPILILACRATIQTTNQAATTLAKHKAIAVLPFQVIIASKSQKINRYKDSEIEELKKFTSLALQRHLYETLKSKQKNFPYTVTLQSGEITDSILSSNKISFARVFENDKTQLCKMLQVDAVIFPKMIFGKRPQSHIKDLWFDGDLEMNAAIYDSSLATPIWQFNHQMNYDGILLQKRVLDLPDNKSQELVMHWMHVIDGLFHNFTADFPYKKK